MTTPILKTLLPTVTNSRIVARQVETGFTLVLLIQDQEKVLQAQRGGIRIFKKLDNLAKYTISIGANRFEVELLAQPMQS